MIKNNKAFSLIELVVTMAIIGVVVLMMPKFFLANVSMNKSFDVQNLYNRTHNLVMQNLQNKPRVLRMMAHLHGTDLVTCLREVKPGANCTRFNMAQPRPIVLTSTMRKDKELHGMEVIDSKQGLQGGDCEDNCLFGIKTSYRLSCRASSCDSIEFTIKTERTQSDDPALKMMKISDRADFVVLNKNDFKKEFSQAMACNDPSRNFLYSFNYLTRMGECKNCGVGDSSCFSPTGGFKNSGVRATAISIEPGTIYLDQPIPENFAVKYHVAQATNAAIGRVEVKCLSGAVNRALPKKHAGNMMGELNGRNSHRGAWDLTPEEVATGTSYALTCTIKGFDPEGIYVVSFASATLRVYAKSPGKGGVPGDGPPVPDGGGDKPNPGGGGGNFTPPSYDIP